MLEFLTNLSTNLKILVMGDSVAIQFAQSLEEAAGGATFDQQLLERESWSGHEGMVISAPMRGVGWWQVGVSCTAMLRRISEGKPLPNAGGGGWLRDDVRTLVNFTYNNNFSASSTEVETVGSIDALIFRIMHWWIVEFAAITAPALQKQLTSR